MTTTLTRGTDPDGHGAAVPEGFGALVALAQRFGFALWFENGWVVPDDDARPVLLLEGDAPLPTVPGDRPTLVARRPREAVVCSDPRDPLIVESAVPGFGRGDLDGRKFWFEDVGVVHGEPLAEIRGFPVVARADRRILVGGVAFLSDRLIAGGDNAALVSWALTGEFAGPVVDFLRGFRYPAEPHALPPVLRLDGVAWDFDDLPPAGTDLSDDVFARAMRRNIRRLPVEAFDSLLEFADEGNSAGALLLRGLPVGKLPATPDSPTAPFDKDLRSEMTLLTVGRLLGQPVGYLPENNGRVVQNIVPTRANADRQVSTSSAVTLAWHTEAAFHRHRPRFLLLFCLRGDPAARTTLCSIREILTALPLRTRAVLSAPRFRTRADESYVGTDRRPFGPLVPVLKGDGGTASLVFDADLMVGVDAEASAALAELAVVVEELHTHVVLEPGDLLVVDNTVAVHGRSPFTPRFDGTDRWLQRTFVVADLSASAGERTGRVIETRFAG